MKVILTQDIPSLGKKTEAVEVKPGYARNYLIPQGKALPANENSLKQLQIKIKKEELHLSKKKQEAEELAKKLNEVSCTATVQAGEDDKLYGSVSIPDIVKLLGDQGVDIDKNKIILEEPIKALGVYNIPIKLHPEVEATIKLWVVRQ
ncbi:MAG: 50S ribosomal protein L9 [Candidatus Edwardsbacteria bacterium RIFOXYD12_FULL_50_11]|jgi:large subunit ribosomal protein L9|uniref:Large ribosomal subunit protein bL9 n=1 Tax=Candidatus Edwardsbacteria bacterium GWF2_54_11 TaxID=1817851 RepID=A0A1F5R775_9BACT|nr:50S ribosomal protein L9 [Candidatus Edwardsbacteria bacterium]OGF05108.1 MAG: 50S ribosomal protein L9 [Candidatus Edwardsbacteria bacterium RifOxyC12_full_54_24]OGF08257.1 MAG: 50S ribosomal protein L9 [Candidatus Edwardsbacteria bacterium RifOxyA12_full_54_48]OGF10308.1 MAG: 50S ribosomal protein L9 [Candidatus Edwardsbacteria bacterium GWF2_54_11]OGF11554.1 MAG: 50S ribosomal protein L9 [Candidatus Edwardsbacteria bacterium GWE2_54_12]OGF17341.1 MAG: 50S ribosomal protein L9 [Candidatus